MSNSMIEMIDNRIHHIFPVPEAYALSPFNLEEFRDCLITMIIKDAYTMREPKNSIRSYRGTDSDDLRMRDSRAKAYSQYYRDLQYNRIKSYGIDIPELHTDDVKTMEGKLTGHQLTKMQYFELNTMSEYPLLKAIINKRICNVKKISNTSFIDYFSGYEKLTSSLVEMLDGSDEDVVFATIAIFTLEWKYNVELFYSCAVQAEKNSTDDIPLNRISRLCTELSMPLLPYCTQTLRTESRFILHRKKLIPNVYESSDDEWLVINNKLYQYFCAKYHIKNGIVRKWDMAGFFARYTSTEQWASFFREHYNLRDFNQKREWTPKRIRYVRKLYQELYLDIEPPKL